VKIIKEGLKKTQQKPYTLTFRCLHCGCEFKLEEGDFYTTNTDDSHYSRGGTIYYATCPNADCRAQVSAS
jgi:hypothetical protein